MRPSIDPSQRAAVRPLLALAAVLAAGVAGAAGAVGCGGDPRVAIEVVGAAPGAEYLEVLLLKPLVIARRQRHNEPSPNGGPPDPSEALETVYYMAERASVTYPLGGGLADRLELEIRDDDGPYVPLVIARRGEQAIAMGVYDPESIFAAKVGEEHQPSVARPVSDVTIYQVQLEPIAATLPAPAAVPDAPPRVEAMQVMSVRCEGSAAPSGLVWRLRGGQQLRVLLARGSSTPGAEDRLDPPDLDCDDHSPGAGGLPRHDLGDQRDCDDTVAAIHGGAKEACSKLDEDCNFGTTETRVSCGGIACPGDTCVCVDPGPSLECAIPANPGVCTIPAEASSSGPGIEPCDSAGFVELPSCGGTSCSVALVIEPDGFEVKIAAGPGGPAHGPGEKIMVIGGKVYVQIHAERSFLAPTVLEPIVLRVGPQAPMAPEAQTIRLELGTSGNSCQSPVSPLLCQ